MMSVLRLAVLGAVALSVSCASPQAQTPLQAQPTIAVERPSGWANSRSDLPKDPDYTLGVLPNGMRYLVLPNRNPPNQVAMRLVMAAGSMHEDKEQEGIAHFLEHLSFRGTKLFPDGEMQRRLEALGLQMVSDVNATTHATHTTFLLDMARNDQESIDTGLTVLREIASELNLAPEMIDAERGVVLAEERLRAGPQSEAIVQALKLQLGDHPYAREVIGKRRVIETLTQEQIRAFYDAYYRPERATLVIVGDIDAERVVPALASRFGDWIARGPAGVDPPPVTTKPAAPDVSVLSVPGSGDSAITLRWFEPYRSRPHTRAERRRQLVEQLGVAAVGQRLVEMNEAAGKPARSISAASPSRISSIWNGHISQAIGVVDPEKTIELMVLAQRQAVELGITQEELDRVISLRLEAARQAAATGRTGTSGSMADALAMQLNSDPVFVSPQDSLDLLEQQLKTVTLKEVNVALRARFVDTPSLVYRGSADPKGGVEALRAAYTAAMTKPASAYAVSAIKPWPYRNFGAPGKVASRLDIEDLGVTFVRFDNGVRLTVKPGSVRKDDVLVRVRLGFGRLGMPRDRIDASDMGASIWSTGGLGKLTPAERTRTLAGRRVAASVETADDAFELTNGSGGVTTAADFGLQMELMAAMVTDPGLRTQEWAGLMALADRADESFERTASGVLNYNLPRLLHSGDLRWTYNTKAMRDSWKPEDAATFIKPIILNSPMEVIVVGDITVEKAISEVGRTLGALPWRTMTAEPAGIRDVKIPKATPKPVEVTHKGRADQGAVVIAWPTQDVRTDRRAARVGWVLSQMLRDEATRRFRTDSSATYSPVAMTEFSHTLNGYGYVGLSLEIPPDRADAALAEIETIAATLASGPVWETEVTRIVGPRMEAMKRDMANNAFWAEALSGAQEDSRRLEAIRTLISDYQSIAAADVHAAAKRWLKPETAWKLKVVPEAKAR